jgi:hypothetical protein
VPSVLAVNEADLQDRWALQGGDEAAQAKRWDIVRTSAKTGEGGEAMTVAEETAVRVDGGTDNVTTVVARA